MRIHKSSIEDLIFAAANLSPGDLSDFNSMITNRHPTDVFPKALDETTHTIELNGKVLAVGGYPNGGIWFVTTTEISTLTQAERYKFYRLLKAHLALIKKESANGVLFTNYVAVANTPHMRLVEKLGANLQADHALSPAGFPFKQFWL